MRIVRGIYVGEELSRRWCWGWRKYWRDPIGPRRIARRLGLAAACGGAAYAYTYGGDLVAGMLQSGRWTRHLTLNCGLDGGADGIDAWDDLKQQLEEVRSNTSGALEAKATRTEHSTLVRFYVPHDDVDMFEVLVCLLEVLGEGVTEEQAYNVRLNVSDAPSSSSLDIRSDDFHIYVFRPQVGPFMTEMIFEKYNRAIQPKEVDALVAAYQLSQMQPAKDAATAKPADAPPRANATPPDVVTAEKELLELGVTVHRAEEGMDWDDLAGYDQVKRQIDDSLTYVLIYPDIYERITRQTRKRLQSSRPRAVLFEGPPGCGKTTTGKILASQVGVPFVHVPIESVMSRWYGESEQKLSKVLTTCSKLGPALIFLDEIDALGASRDNDIHEASRKMLSVLLRHIDGMDGQQPTIMIAATNRKSDLDQALLSRFDTVIRFELPDTQARKQMFGLYAKHLSDKEVSKLASASGGLSGRNVLDVCKEAERICAGRLIRKETSDADAVPTVDDYIVGIQRRVRASGPDIRLRGE